MYTGQLADFPLEVIERMVHNQVQQGNKADTNVFSCTRNAQLSFGGFNWFFSDEGNEFWHEVIEEMNFDLFFEKYPRQSTVTNIKIDFVDSAVLLLLVGMVENLTIDRKSFISDSDRIFQFETIHLTIVKRFLDRMKLKYEIV